MPTLTDMPSGPPPAAAPGTATTVERQRPTVVGRDLRRFWNLTWTLAATDFKLRFYGSVLGYVWTLARPFLFFLVVYTVFSQIIELDASVKNYGLYILFGLVVFQFFAEATGGSVTSLVSRENLLRKMQFPRLVIPMAVLVTALLNLAMTLVAVFIFAMATGVYPDWSWLQLPFLLGIVVLLALGVGLILAALFVRYRDVQPIWDVAIQMLFYASPILYVTTMVPEAYQRAYLANPLAAVLTQIRHAVIDPTAQPVWQSIGGAERLLVPGGLVVAVLALGLWYFNREAPRIAENL